MQEQLPSRWFNGIEYYNIGNAAKYIGKSPNGLNSLIKRLKGTDEEIQVHELAGSKWERYIKRSDLDRYMRPIPVQTKE